MRASSARALESLQQQFIVDNRPARAATSAPKQPRKSAPTLHVPRLRESGDRREPSLYKNSVDAERDFVPVARGVVRPGDLRSSFGPCETLGELVAPAGASREALIRLRGNGADFSRIACSKGLGCEVPARAFQGHGPVMPALLAGR